MSLEQLVQLYKPVGKTPLEIVNDFKRGRDVKKVAYCGRLDPMAHGYLLLACDSEVKNMETYNSKDKVYTVKVLVGVSTDSTDRLGIIGDVKEGKFGETTIDCVNSYNGKIYDQVFHMYSSIMVIDPKTKCRVPYWYLTKLGRVPEKIPSKQVTIHSVSDVLLKEYGLDDIKRCVFEEGLDLLTSSGDFGIDNVRSTWNSYFFKKYSTDRFEVITFTVNVSSGTYIRQLVKDISLEIGVPLMVLDLFRHKF